MKPVFSNLLTTKYSLMFLWTNAKHLKKFQTSLLEIIPGGRVDQVDARFKRDSYDFQTLRLVYFTKAPPCRLEEGKRY